MPNVSKPLIVVVLLLVVSLLAGCGGGETQARAPRPSAPVAATTEGPTVPEGTMAVAAAHTTQETSSGGQKVVQTCDGGSIRLNAAENRLVELHNEARTQRGLEPLCVNPTLTQAARAHSQDMIDKDYFAHTSPSGETLGGRLKRFGYTPEGYHFWKVGGNIAWHSGPEPKPEKMVEGWMNSPPHRHNILDEDFRQIGIGTAAGEYKSFEESVMYTADFGVRRG